jgi:CelD/BcsL family acetyltransferase involved in cellulose biosynthesis
MSISSHVVTSDEGFRLLKPEWSDLVGCMPRDIPRFFNSWEWNFHWWNHYCGKLGNASLQIIAFYQSGRLVGLVPGYLRLQSGGFSTLHLLGDRFETSLYADFLIDETCREEVFGQLATILANRRVWFLTACHVHADANCGKFSLRYSHRIEPTGESLYVVLPKSFPDFLARRRRNMQKDRKRIREELGGEMVDLLPRGRQAVELLFELHEQGFQEMGKPTRFRKAQRLEFHSELIQSLAASGNVYLLGVQIDGRVVAVSYGFCNGSCSIGYQMGYDPSFRKYGIGFQLVLNETEWAIARGLQEHDLSIGGGAHKAAFHGQPRPLHRLTVAFNPPARALLWCRDGLLSGKRLARRFLKPGSVRSEPDAPSKS